MLFVKLDGCNSLYVIDIWICKMQDTKVGGSRRTERT